MRNRLLTCIFLSALAQGCAEFGADGADTANEDSQLSAEELRRAKWKRRADAGVSADAASPSVPVTQPTPVATPEPAPVATPEPTPVATPEPVVTPEPTPEPVVTPEPTPEPVVTPEPTPEPVVTPEPTPVVPPVSAPAAGSASAPFPANTGFDYQLGGAYALPAGVKIVVRDRTMAPQSGAYNICYINAYQAQANEREFWLSSHPDLVLRDANGQPVEDPNWNEMLLDISTASKRAALAGIVTSWIRTCKDAGYQAVDFDNLDTFQRSGGRISMDNAVAYTRLLTDLVHGLGMRAGQKNAVELVDRKAAMGTDFAMVEECNRYRECTPYLNAYGTQVLMLEFRRQDFDVGCSSYPNVSVIMRDVQLTRAGSSGYVFESC